MASSRDCSPKSSIIKAHQSQVGLNAPHTSPPRPHTCHQKSLSYSLCVPSTHHQFFYSLSTNIFAEWINLSMKPALFSPRTYSINLFFFFFQGLPWWLSGKASVYNAGDLGLIIGLGRSSWRRKWHPLKYSCLKIPKAPEPSWQATVHRVVKSQTWLRD